MSLTGSEFQTAGSIKLNERSPKPLKQEVKKTALLISRTGLDSTEGDRQQQLNGVLLLTRLISNMLDDPRFEPRQEHKKKLGKFFRVKNVVLTRCRLVCPTPRVYIRTHESDHVRTLTIL